MAKNQLEKTNGNPEALSALNGSLGAVRKMRADDVGRLVAAGHSFENLIKFEEGDLVEGIFAGEGPTMEMETPGTGEIHPVKTWRIQVAPGQTARLIGSHQIDRELGAAALGDRVCVVFMGKKETRKGTHVNDFRISIVKAKAPAADPMA